MAAKTDIIGALKGSSQAAGDKTPQHVMITDSSGNVIETFGGSGGTSQADKTTFTSTSTQGTPAMGAYEATPTTLTDGQVGVIGLTANRELKVSVTSGGTAGTQYTEGDTDTTITGTAVMFESNTGTSALGVVSSATPLPVTLANTGANATAVKVDGSAVTQPISGTVTANAGSGPFPVSDNAGSLTVDAPVGTPVFVRLSDGAAAISTLPVSGPLTDVQLRATAVPVSLASAPSTPVTNAGTFAVQESGAALTSLQLIDDGVATVASAIPTKGMVAIGTDGTNARALKTDTNGELQVDVLTVPADPFGANADAASATGSISAKLRFIASTGIPITGTVTVGSHAVTNAGTFAVQDSEKIADDAAFTVATTKVLPVGLLADDTSPDSVNEGDIGAPRMTLARKQITVSTADTATLSNVAASATSVTVDAANDARIGLIVHNDSTATLYLKYGATASTTSYTVKILGDGYWEMPPPIYRGVVDGIWSSATGSARVTELT